MGILQVVTDNWFTALQSFGIISGFFFTAAVYRKDEKSRRVTNRLIIEDHHRSIWAACYGNPSLARILDPKADIHRNPLTNDELLFCNELIIHLSGSFLSINEGMLTTPEGLRKDVDRLFSLPIPRAAWEKYRAFQDRNFVEFVEADGRRDDE